MEIRKTKLEQPWPPRDRQVGVILVAHSMGQVTLLSIPDTLSALHFPS